MLPDRKQQLWNELIVDASSTELSWMNGYLQGWLTAKEGSVPLIKQEEIQATDIGKVTLLYGTETGNAKSLATKLASIAKSKGATVKLQAMDQYNVAQLSKEKQLFVIVSTQGDGEPPETAKVFYSYLFEQQLSLADLKYAVLALGDSSYPAFCQTGIDIDGQLAKANAHRFYPLLKCDTDYEAEADAWFQKAILELRQPNGVSRLTQFDTAVSKRSTKQFFSGKITHHVNLNDHGSNKETYHIEIDTEASYQPGDSLSIKPINPMSSVLEILSIIGKDGVEEVAYKDKKYQLITLLKEHWNITFLSERTIKAYAALTGYEIPDVKFGLTDLLKIYPPKNEDQLVGLWNLLEGNIPRQYSISSSPSAHEQSIHLTVSKHLYKLNDAVSVGACSNYLAQLAVGEEIAFSIHTNNNFRLPASHKDIILIGPGTGIAPFRSFLAEREAAGASGRNWLFFGDQHFVSDFLYQTEIQAWFETGLLTNVSVAFSRDQEEKIYVQHKMQEHAAELYKWIDEGALVYVCGSKDPMSKDVEIALLNIIEQEGKMESAAAVDFLNKLENEQRYLKDVY